MRSNAGQYKHKEEIIDIVWLLYKQPTTVLWSICWLCFS